MAIDEKQIGEDMHAIISNREIGKITLIISSLCYSDLQKLLNGKDPACRKGETLTRDLSPLYAKVGNELFFNASPIADKFHIIKSLMEACQDVRIQLRQELLGESALESLARSRYLLNILMTGRLNKEKGLVHCSRNILKSKLFMSIYVSSGTG